MKQLKKLQKLQIDNRLNGKIKHSIRYKIWIELALSNSVNQLKVSIFHLELDLHETTKNKN